MQKVYTRVVALCRCDASLMCEGYAGDGGGGDGSDVGGGRERLLGDVAQVPGDLFGGGGDGGVEIGLDAAARRRIDRGPEDRARDECDEGEDGDGGDELDEGEPASGRECGRAWTAPG